MPEEPTASTVSWRKSSTTAFVIYLKPNGNSFPKDKLPLLKAAFPNIRCDGDYLSIEVPGENRNVADTAAIELYTILHDLGLWVGLELPVSVPA
jgi:hypothetical protein